MTDPLVITHSDIATYIQCRRKWTWDFILDYRKPEVSFGPLACGSRVHKAIEHYYKTGDDPVVEHERLFKLDHDALEADPDCPPWGMDQIYKDAIMGRNAVTAHQEWLATEGADTGYEVVAVEQTTEVPMLDGKVLLRCKADVVFRNMSNGFLVLNDLKTDGGMYGLREMLERSWQHSTYLIALRLKHPEEYVQEAYYTIIKKVMNVKRVKTGMVERHRVPGTTRTAENKLKQLEVVLTEMVNRYGTISKPGNEHFAYPVPSQACRFCEYRQPCEIADESTAASVALLDSQYMRGGRHARYK